MSAAAPRIMLSRQNMLKPAQYVPEGYIPSTYGVVGNNPRFIAPGQRSWIEGTPEPEFVDNEFGGHYDRQGVVKTREQNRLTYHSRLVSADYPLVRWCTALPVHLASANPNESFTWLDSYRSAGGREVFRVWKGCKPISSTISITKSEPIMLDIEMSSQRYFETETLADAFALGGGSLVAEAPNTGRFQNSYPLRFKDVGKFMYGTREIAYRSLTLTTTYAQKTQDSNGLEYNAFVEPAARRMSGSVDIFKSGFELNEDARAGIQRPGYFILQDKAGDDVAASMQIAANFRVTARIPGAWGNQLQLKIDIAKAGANANGEARVDGNTIIVESPAAITNVRVKAALEANRETNDLVVIANAPAGNVAVKAATPFTGGQDSDWKFVLERLRFLPTSEGLIDDSEATMESKSLEADVLTMYEGA